MCNTGKHRADTKLSICNNISIVIVVIVVYVVVIVIMCLALPNEVWYGVLSVRVYDL